MAKTKRDLVDVACPCCGAELRVDPNLKAVISYKEREKPRTVENLQEAVQKLKGEESRRDEVFRKSLDDHKSREQVLNRKFDELLRQAKESPEEAPPKRPFDFD